MINRGDPLVDIDPRPYEAQLQQAEGPLDRDRGILRQARMDLERYQQAYAKNAVAKQILDDQEQSQTHPSGHGGHNVAVAHLHLFIADLPHIVLDYTLILGHESLRATTVRWPYSHNSNR